MNLKHIHNAEKSISAVPVFKTENGSTIAIRIKEGEKLKEHITKVSALLVCVNGKAIFENEKGTKQNLSVGDYIEIEPMVVHWVNAINESSFLLIKS